MPSSDLDFIRDLRACVDRYLRAVDAWEAEYHRFYRLPASHRRVPPDMEKAQHNYIVARRQMERCIPRARRLCREFELRDPWPGLLRIELGCGSALGRNERMTIAGCLGDLELRYAESHSTPPEPPPRPRPIRWLRRIIDYFM